MTLQDFDPAERFVAGTVGPAGQRAFYLQASDGPRVVTVAVEKQQEVFVFEGNSLLAAYAKYLTEYLDQ